ncbi:MAG: ATPase domain-containing protein, partial [Candidatus Thorarchaeota archaeon]
MNEVGALPPSIVDILGQDQGYVILVNGKPGVGKTMLAQEIARTFPNTFMIITSSENIVNYKGALIEVHPEWDKHHAAVPFWRSNLREDMSQLNLNEQLSALTGKTVQLDGCDIIVIDSWTDFLAPYEPAKRSELEHALTETARREGKRLVLISDCSEDNQCSPGTLRAADGVVTLDRLREEQRVYRRIIIEKMRGVPIEQDEFLFTLHGGRFTYIPWYKHRYPAITVEREPISDPSKDMISTGSRSLDRVLGGGFQKGALNLVELESITAPYLETIYIPFLSNQLQLGRPVVIVLPEGWSSERFVHGLGHFVDKKI